MSAWVWVAAAGLVVTKALDCVTTLRAVGPRGVAETNPIGCWIMQRLGVMGAVGLVFVVCAVLAVALAAVVVASGSDLLAGGYVAVAGLVAFVQGSVAHTNWSGRWNAVTVRVRALHRGMARVCGG